MSTLEEQRLHEEAFKDRNITIGHAANIAKEFVGQANLDPVQSAGAFATIFPDIVEALLAVKGEHAVRVVLGASPEPQNVTQTAAYVAAGGPPVQPVPNYDAAAPNPTYQQVQRAPIPGASDGDPEFAALWNTFFSDVGAWNDKRGNKKGPNSPDFQHKSLKQPGTDFPLALWVEGKKNPSWVKPQLQAVGLL